MNRPRIALTATAALIALALCLVPLARAQDPMGGAAAPKAEDHDHDHDHEKETSEAPATAADDSAQATMMEEWEKLAAPGEHHKHIAAMEGDFQATAKMWMNPGEPQISTGKSSNRLIFGGRWLQSDFSGEMMGRPFKGMMLLGYDNASEKYISVWIDEMSTGAMQATGTCSDDGKTITLIGEGYDPAGGQPVRTTQVFHVKGPDLHVFEMYEPGPDGKDQKTLEVTYERVK